MEHMFFQAMAIIIAGVLGAIWRQLWSLNKEFTYIKAGTRIGLLADIDRIHRGAEKNGEISEFAQRIALECYSQYKNLGGNGHAEKMIADIKEYPTKR